jgi:hypothetical protein
MNEDIFLAAFFFPTVAAVLIFFMKYLSAILQARVRLGQDEAYKDMAAKVAMVQAETGAALAAMETRLAGIEKILRDVG